MSLPRSERIYTVEEYLTLERASEDRHEFLDGHIYVMAGESDEHGDISVNLVSELHRQLRGTPCRVRTKDTKVRCGPDPSTRYRTKGLYSYPDIVVVCGDRQYHDQHKDVLLNPTVVIEILSSSTEAFDRGEKWLRYQTWLTTLTNYILISQAAPKIEQYVRQSNGEWLYSLINSLECELRIASINCVLKLADIYDRIIFPDDEPETLDEDPVI